MILWLGPLSIPLKRLIGAMFFPDERFTSCCFSLYRVWWPHLGPSHEPLPSLTIHSYIYPKLLLSGQEPSFSQTPPFLSTSNCISSYLLESLSPGSGRTSHTAIGHQGPAVPVVLPFSPKGSLLLPTPREVLIHTSALAK